MPIISKFKGIFPYRSAYLILSRCMLAPWGQYLEYMYMIIMCSGFKMIDLVLQIHTNVPVACTVTSKFCFWCRGIHMIQTLQLIHVYLMMSMVQYESLNKLTIKSLECHYLCARRTSALHNPLTPLMQL